LITEGVRRREVEDGGGRGTWKGNKGRGRGRRKEKREEEGRRREKEGEGGRKEKEGHTLTNATDCHVPRNTLAGSGRAGSKNSICVTRARGKAGTPVGTDVRAASCGRVARVYRWSGVRIKNENTENLSFNGRGKKNTLAGVRAGVVAKSRNTCARGICDVRKQRVRFTKATSLPWPIVLANVGTSSIISVLARVHGCQEIKMKGRQKMPNIYNFKEFEEKFRKFKQTPLAAFRKSEKGMRISK
jgi:hypothetical protein